MNNTVERPVCKLIGEDGNIFNLVGIAAKTLKKAGLNNQVVEMQDKVFASDSYDQALSIISEYVKIS